MVTTTAVTEFFAMGGYAPYVWGSFGLSFIVIAANIFTTGRLRRKVVAEVSRMNTVTPKTLSENPQNDTSNNSPAHSSREAS